MVSHASKKGFGSHNERFYEEYEYERKLKKRKARLISAAEEAFTHIKRMQTNQPSMYKIGYFKKIIKKFHEIFNNIFVKLTFQLCVPNHVILKYFY